APTWRLPPSATLFPYTTLFRSGGTTISSVPSVTATSTSRVEPGFSVSSVRSSSPSPTPTSNTWRVSSIVVGTHTDDPTFAGRPRSEEHTSELQSRENLVCRLLL